MSIPVALQLYTLREEMKHDFIGTLEKVAELGYKGVEFAGFGGLSAEDLKACLDRLGLKAAAAHIPVEELKDNLDGVIEYNLKIGNKYIVCPWAKYESKEDFMNMAEFLKNVGRKCRENGLTLCYHNHAHEFTSFNNEYGIDILYKSVPEELLKAEVDTYWVQYANVDAVEFIKKYAERTPLIHLKDMADTIEREFTEIGNGTMDIKTIAETAEKIGSEWLIVEQDKCSGPAIESVKVSMENLEKMNLA